MAIYTGDNCFWCGKQDMTVLILDQNNEDHNFMLCVPCLNQVYEDWKCEQASIPPILTRIK